MNILFGMKGHIVGARKKDLIWESGIALRDHSKMVVNINNWSGNNLLGKLLEEVRDELAIV